MADLRVAVEPGRRGHPTQRIYLDGHELSGVRRVRVRSAWGRRTVSIDLDLDGVSIDSRAVSQFWGVCGDDKVDITIDADNVDSPVAEELMPGWTRGPARAYRRPDVFDEARECYARLRHGGWLIVVGVIYLVVSILGVFMEQALLEYANGLRQGLWGSPDDE